MNRRTMYIVMAVVVMGSAGALLAIQRNESTPDTKKNTQNQTAYDEIAVNLNNGAQLIDVRTPEEFADGHIASAVNLPLQSIEQGVLPKVSKETKLYIYCRSGNRSAQASKILRDEGYSQIRDLGGITAVQSMGGKLAE